MFADMPQLARFSAVTLLVTLAGAFAAALAQEESDSEPPAGAALLKTDILAVLAHPDDEVMMAATIARYALVDGKTVAHVYCTRGEGGGNMVGTQWGPALGILREQELRDCLRTLGVRACYFLDQVDWAYTESASMTLEKWDHDAAVERLTRFIRTLRPEVVLTMSPFPRPGWHGHHQAAGMLAVEATAAAADPDAHAKQISREGLAAWRVPKVYYRGSLKEGLNSAEASINSRYLLPGGKSVHATVREALANHRSQGFGRFSRGGSLMPPETFVRLRSIVDNGATENDLFEGLDAVSTKTETLWLSPPVNPASKGTQLYFEPRPAVTNFLKWSDKNRVRHLAGAIKSDIPAIRGSSTLLKLHASNFDSGTLRFSTSTPNITLPKPIDLTGASETIDVPIQVPASQAEDFEIQATLDRETSTETATATLHPVPMARAAQAPPGLTVENDAGWSAIPSTSIPPELLVQGKVASPEDCSATFRVAHDARALYCQVTVTDDAIVSNIAPNDIRGHWRSDSVEFCIDPGGSEHTLTCFKLGVFPFDSSGNVRAARDADANQGPVEETAPGTRLFSERLSDSTGYRIRVAIPLTEAGITIKQGPATIGFNIIVYDGDKPDAARGENINEARLAWSPRSGVQGRPEDWGQMVLNDT